MNIRGFFKHPWINIVVIVALTIGFGVFIRNAELDNDLTKILPPKNASIEAFRNTEKTFGGTDIMVIGLRAKEGSILTPENLKIIDGISNDVMQITWNEAEAEKQGYKAVKTKKTTESTESAPAEGDLLDDFGSSDLLSDFGGADDTAVESDDLLGDFAAAESVEMVTKDPNDKTPPAMADGLKLVQKSNSLEITWSDPADADLEYVEVHYKMPRSDDVKKVQKGKQFCIAESLAYDETYQVTLTAVDVNGNRSAPVKTKWRMTIPEGLQMVDDVMSITNSKSIRMVDGELKIEKLSEPALPENMEDLKEYIEKLYSWDLYNVNLISSDKKSAAIYLLMPGGMKSAHYAYLNTEVQKVIQNNVNDNIEVYQSGTPTLFVKVSEYMVKDLLVLIPLVAIIVLLTLYISFAGRVGGVIWPLCCVAISALITVGFMGLLGKRLDLVATTIPVSLIAIGSAYGIHVMTHYYEELKVRKRVTVAEHKEMIFDLLKSVGVPVFLAGITTVAGFISFVTAPVETLRNFGLFTALGVSVAIIASLVFIPSVLLLRKKDIVIKDKVQHEDAENAGGNSTVVGLRHLKRLKYLRKEHHFFTRALFDIYRFLSEKKSRTIGLIIVILAVSIFGIYRIQIDSQPISYFKKSSPVSIADKYLCDHFAGTNFLDITIKGQEAGSLANPNVIYQMDRLAKFLEDKYPDVKKTMGYPDFIKKMNEVMNSDGSKAQNEMYYEIPMDYQKYKMESESQLKDVIVQYLLLLGDDVSRYVAGADPLAPEAARVTLLMTQASSEFTRSLIKDINTFCAENIPEGYSVSVSGTADYLDALNALVVSTQVQSIILSGLMILLFIIAQYRSFSAGIIGMIPLALAVVLNFGLMGIFGITLNIGTAIIASVSIGMGVDYTIHFLAAYKIQRAKSDDLKEVTKNTLLVAGKAIICNAAAVCLGFLVLVLSNFMPLVNVGILLAFVMITSSFGALVILPAILKFVDPKFLRPIK